MSKVVTLEELKKHTSKDSLYVLLHEKVYDVTKFIDEHPGGDEVILAEAGIDATEAFEDVGHSDEARALLPDLLVGTFDKSSADIKLFDEKKEPSTTTVNVAVEQGSNVMYFVPLALLGAYFAWRYYSTGLA